MEFAAFDAASGVGDGVHAGAAETIDGGAGDFDGKASEKEGHTADIAIIFTGLIGAAVEDVVERIPINHRVAFDEGFDGNSGKVVGADGRESTGVAADGRTNGVTDVSEGHIDMDAGSRIQSTAYGWQTSK